MSVEQEIISWDGKSSNDIDAIYRGHNDDEDFLSEIIELSQEEPPRKGVRSRFDGYRTDVPIQSTY